MLKFLRLSGPEVAITTTPQKCHSCGCKDLYQQADFKRSVGVGLMIVASLLTCVFLAYDFNWWAVWSPMFVLLAFDMFLRRITPLAAICYECATIHRGASLQALQSLPSFDLETFDRIQYKKVEGEA